MISRGGSHSFPRHCSRLLGGLAVSPPSKCPQHVWAKVILQLLAFDPGVVEGEYNVTVVGGPGPLQVLLTVIFDGWERVGAAECEWWQV